MITLLRRVRESDGRCVLYRQWRVLVPEEKLRTFPQVTGAPDRSAIGSPAFLGDERGYRHRGLRQPPVDQEAQLMTPRWSGGEGPSTATLRCGYGGPTR